FLAPVPDEWRIWRPPGESSLSRSLPERKLPDRGARKPESSGEAGSLAWGMQARWVSGGGDGGFSPPFQRVPTNSKCLLFRVSYSFRVPISSGKNSPIPVPNVGSYVGR
ncbi:MAG TPA: hypothetical protein VM532_04820, partial [Burkholderiales bacterium]|nr:hypothetical protein [Burkholderiales bacterium]